MTIVVLLIVVGLLPPALSWWASFRAERRVMERFERAREARQYSTLHSWRQRDPDERYIDGMGLVIGDITCQLNARSPHIRCAVNPLGPCEGCRAYEGRIYEPI
ncbi:MAG: DUF6464 family protein [Leptolyngbyaceae cyanobacterium]